ncbi:MAG: hypothetical protein VYB54_08035 [Pseudomonadota bacterium]|nr:hypothetical protein [Pseudomonadota bacterium]
MHRLVPVLSGLAVLLGIAALPLAASAAPLEKPEARNFPVSLAYSVTARDLRGVKLDCKVFEASDGQFVGRGSTVWRLDPGWKYRAATLTGDLSVPLRAGTDPDTPKTCSCMARFDTRHLLSSAAADDDGERPWLFARSRRFAETACSPGRLIEQVAMSRPVE